MKLSELQVGDILVQDKGQPWVTFAQIFTGEPYPHSAVIAKADAYSVHILEDGPFGVSEYVLTEKQFADFQVWRPNCDQETRQKAVAWMQKHRGEGYGYLHLATIVVAYRLGLRHRPGMDDDISQDNRRKVCSELIAMGYLRSGYDVVPQVQDIDTLPKDLRCPQTCTLMP